MRISLQRKIDRVVGKFICRLLTLITKRGDPRERLPASPKILVILLSEMGSLVLAHPMFALLKERYPKARLLALVFEKNRECLETLGLLPKENILSVDGDSFFALSRDSIRFLHKMRKQKVDVVLDCELFSRVSAIYALLSGAGIRVGFHRHTQEGLYRGDFINRPVLYNPYRHISRQFVSLAMAMERRNGFPIIKENASSGIFHIPTLIPHKDQLRGFRNRLIKDFPEITGRQTVLLYPGGGLLPIRAWPLENFCRISDDLLLSGYAVGVIGMKEDRPKAQAILSCCQSEFCFDLTGYTKTVMELIMLFHLASLLITNDGGPGHFASLTPIPSIVFFGPETPLLYGPLDAKTVTLHKALPCSPCLSAYNHRNSPCDGNNVCLKEIAPEEVLREAYGLLKENDIGNGRD